MAECVNCGAHTNVTDLQGRPICCEICLRTPSACECRQTPITYSLKGENKAMWPLHINQPKLGDLVEDKVSGFQGIVTSSHDYLSGCTRMCVQPKVGADGKLPEIETFDIDQLKVLRRNAVEEGNRQTGGPGEMPKDRPIG